MARRTSLSALHSHMSPSFDPRNENMNAAFTPPWANGDAMNHLNVGGPSVPQGDTRFDPFIGSSWGRYLDAMGAKDPGGVNLSDRMSSPGGRLPMSPLELPSTAFTGQEENSPYGATPVENQLPAKHMRNPLNAPMPSTRFTGDESNSPFGGTPSLDALQRGMTPMRRQADQYARAKYPGASDNIVWGS